MNTNFCGIRSLVAVSATALLTLGAAGCASSPDLSDRQLARAETTIEHAAQTGAQTHATGALGSAREKLAQAQRANEEGDDVKATWLARQAELDAELAASQTDHQKAAQALAEINESLATLRHELERNESKEGGTR